MISDVSDGLRLRKMPTALSVQHLPRIKPLEEKIELFLQLGSVVGILIDPDKLTVTLYRLNQTPVMLENGDTLTLPDLLPGWELAVSELWPPEFE